MAGLIYQRMFCPEEIADVGQFRSEKELSTTQLRIKRDHDGERELVVRLPLIENPPSGLFTGDHDITVKIKLGSAVIPTKRDPLYVMICDKRDAAIGFKISESGPIKGAEGTPGRYLNSLTLKGDDTETASLTTTDWPDEFNLILKPKSYWGTIFCSQGNGTKQCVGYGKQPDFSKGVYLDIYRHDPIEEYIINYIEVSIYRGGLVNQAGCIPS